MTVAPLERTATPEAAMGGLPPPASTPRAIRTLARVEGRKLLRHPAFIPGIALSGALVLLAGWGRKSHSVVEPLWPAGSPIGPLAVFGFVAANLAALRDRVNGTEELFGSTAVPRRARTAALLVSVAWAVGASVVLLAPFVGAFAVSYGVSLADVVKLLEEPLIVAVLALAGVAVGRLLPTRLAAPVAAFFAFVLVGAYAHPTLAPQFLSLYVIPDSLPSVGWHILYLAGIGTLATAVALMKDGVRRSLVVAAAVGVLAIAAGAILQLPASCPGGGAPCVFR
jgi:hypothetical protein